MSTISFIELHDEYLAGVPGCSFITASQAVRRAAQEFCERTRAWRVALPAQSTTANVTDYLFNVDAGQTIVRTLKATVDGHPFLLLRPSDAGPGVRGIVVHNEREYSIHPAPAAGQQVVFFCAVAPANNAAGIDSNVYAKYARAIAMGAKAELFSMQNQPFTNPAAAIDERSSFEVEISRAIHDVNRNFSTAPVRVKINSF